ncbi:DUF2958 domain-containing protein [Dawidia soli]|uniref:DUF2958 domain-containing protein n=1 Tax=Dawidia soli TaxID=2782352 RepID=A0AAP2DEN2_9BACT|nr:DUF2958 domain-containing protein [Dawidia soli]MBT1689882.1 DUF2958 domain-containing protein [Dawidia soli]
MSSNLLTRELIAKLKQNGLTPDEDVPPVVKLFAPGTDAAWLLRDVVEDDPDIAFGLCDLGLGFPELGYVSLAELETFRGPRGLKIERDLYFEAQYPLSVYTRAARECCAITFDPELLKRAAELKPE